MRTLQYVEDFDCSPSTLFKALHTPSQIRQWWEAAQAIVIERPNGVFAATWGGTEDDPDFIGTSVLAEFDPPHRLVMTDFIYYAKEGPLGFDADFVVEFSIAAQGRGSRLTLTHKGIPDDPVADEYYKGCNTGWTQCIANLHKLLDA